MIGLVLAGITLYGLLCWACAECLDERMGRR